MAKRESSDQKAVVAEAEKRLGVAFRKIEGQGSLEALKAHAERLSREGADRKID